MENGILLLYFQSLLTQKATKLSLLWGTVESQMIYTVGGIWGKGDGFLFTHKKILTG